MRFSKTSKTNGGKDSAEQNSPVNCFVRGRTPLGFNSELSKCLFPLYGGGKDSAEQKQSGELFL